MHRNSIVFFLLSLLIQIFYKNIDSDLIIKKCIIKLLEVNNIVCVLASEELYSKVM